MRERYLREYWSKEGQASISYIDINCEYRYVIKAEKKKMASVINGLIYSMNCEIHVLDFGRAVGSREWENIGYARFSL